MCDLANKIQDAELFIMRVLWENGGTLPLIDIRRALKERTTWEDATMKTLVRRLQQKGIIRLKSRGVYTAVVSEDEYAKWSTRVFVDKIFFGNAKKLMASLVSGGHLSKEDVAELSAILEEGEAHE